MSGPLERPAPSPAHETPRATRREWMGLAVIALPCLLYSMDLTVLNLAVPSLTADLRPSASELLWIVDIYGFMVAGSLITMGTLGDRIGRRRLLLIGATVFGIASVLVAFSNSAGMLITTRALLGLAGATLAPSTLSLIRNMFHEPGQRTVAIGIWISSYSAGAAIGPLLGGLLLERFWWGSVFLVGVPVMALLLAAGPVLLPEFRVRDAGRVDVVSVLLSMAGLLPVIYGLKRIAEGASGATPFLSIVAGLAFAVAFVRRQRVLADPLLDLRLFRLPSFSASLTLYTLATFVAFGVYVLIAQYLQLVLGLSPLAAGLWTVPFAGGFIVGSMVTPAIVRRSRPDLVMAAGLALAAVGFGLLSQVGGSPDLGLLVAGFVVFSLGLAPVFTLATDLIVGAAPPDRAGAASAISETGSELGGALGIAILGSVGTAVYRGGMASMGPAVPPDAAEAARSTLGGALAVAAGMPDPLRVELLDQARGAFSRSLAMTGAISAVIVILLAVILAIRVRSGRKPVLAGREASPRDPGRWTT